MINIEETLCWQCSKTYPIEAEKCPYCGAANGNVDLEKAQAEQLADFARKMRKSPNPLRKCRHGRVFNGTTCPQCRDEHLEHMNEGVQLPTLEPIDGNWSNTALENWFPYSAEELERLKRENAQLARALAKEVNGPTFMGELVIASKEPIAWVVAVEEQGRMKVYGPEYNWRGHAEQDAELPRKRGQKAEVWACYPTAPPVNKGSNDRNNGEGGGNG